MREDIQQLYDLAFARHDRAAAKRREFAECWARYISVHPWDIDVRNVDPCTLEIVAVMREPAPVELALIFSEWLAALRAALDNALYALAAAVSGEVDPGFRTGGCLVRRPGGPAGWPVGPVGVRTVVG